LVLAVIEKESLGGVCLNWGVSQQKHYWNQLRF
jgi:pyruvate/2-oxoglutarate dehydrogenase complex dihydrolipoamide dehydrogenase (E3) component